MIATCMNKFFVYHYASRYSLKLGQVFDGSNCIFLGKRYEENLRIIFDQWPRLYILSMLDVEAEIQILNGF